MWVPQQAIGRYIRHVTLVHSQGLTFSHLLHWHRLLADGDNLDDWSPIQWQSALSNLLSLKVYIRNFSRDHDECWHPDVERLVDLMKSNSVSLKAKKVEVTFECYMDSTLCTANSRVKEVVETVLKEMIDRNWEAQETDGNANDQLAVEDAMEAHPSTERLQAASDQSKAVVSGAGRSLFG
jgi:hypothetical protein